MTLTTDALTSSEKESKKPSHAFFFDVHVNTKLSKKEGILRIAFP